MSGVVTAIGAAASVVSAASTFFGGGSKAPKATGAEANEKIDTAASKNQKARSQLLATAGGIAGQQLQPGQVLSTGTLFGN